MDISWREGYELRVTVVNGEVVITGNRKGLLSLADQLTLLSKEPIGSHLHLDAYNALEDGSDELIIERVR